MSREKMSIQQRQIFMAPFRENGLLSLFLWAAVTFQVLTDDGSGGYDLSRHPAFKVICSSFRLYFSHWFDLFSNKVFVLTVQPLLHLERQFFIVI